MRFGRARAKVRYKQHSVKGSFKTKHVTHHFAWLVVISCLVGCSTTPAQLGSGNSQFVLGNKYVLKRDAILLGRRGLIDSIENPDRNIDDYKPYKDYDPYFVWPKGVLPSGTILRVKNIRVFKNDTFEVQGEILSGAYKYHTVSPYDAAKGVTIGGWPPTGEVMMEKLCGGPSFDGSQLERNLSEKLNVRSTSEPSPRNH